MTILNRWLSDPDILVGIVSKLQLLWIKNSQFKIIYLDSSTHDPWPFDNTITPLNYYSIIRKPSTENRQPTTPLHHYSTIRFHEKRSTENRLNQSNSSPTTRLHDYPTIRFHEKPSTETDNRLNQSTSPPVHRLLDYPTIRFHEKPSTETDFYPNPKGSS